MLPDLNDLVGHRLGAYRVETLLGSGAVGAVYRARHLGLEQPRAIKVLWPMFALDARIVDRFRHEATVAAGLRHRNIVAIHDVAEEVGLHFVVMDLISAVSMTDLRRSIGPAPLPLSLNLLGQLGQALDYVHDQHLSHGDLKPSNVLIDTQQHLTVVDFGLRRAVQSTEVTTASPSEAAIYVAPEVLGGAPTDRRSDAYSAGVMAYELLAGRPPPRPAAPGTDQGPPAALFTALRPELPAGLERVLLRQISSDPTARFPTVMSFVEALAAAAPASSPRPASSTAAASPDATESTMRVPTPTVVGRAGSTSAKKRPIALLIVGALLVLAVIGAGIVTLRSTGSGAASPTATYAAASIATPKPAAATAAVPPIAAPAVVAPPAAASPAPVATVSETGPVALPTQPASPGAAVSQLDLTPRPSPTTPTGLRTIVDDQFTDNQHRWPDDRRGTSWVADGALRLFGRFPARHVAVGLPLAQPLRDVVVSGSFRKTGGPGGGGYGLIVRDEGPGPRDGLSQGGRYLVFEAGDRGEFGAWRRELDHWDELLPWTASASVRPGAAPNELAVRAIGDQLAFLINGTQVVALRDGALSAGGVGVYLGGDLNEVEVKRFTVQAP